MSENVVSLGLPAQLFAELEALAKEERVEPVEMVSRLVTLAFQKSTWRHNLHALRKEVLKDRDLQTGSTKESVIEQLRQTRHEIFEAEYAHLYR